MCPVSKPRRDEDGASLIIALVFVLLISLILLAIVTLSGTNIVNTTNLQNERTLEYSAEGGVQAALQAIRYATPGQTSTFCGGSPALAPPAPIDGAVVYCQLGDLTYARVLNFEACPPAVSAASCANNVNKADVLTATVLISDVASGCTSGGSPGCYNPPSTSGTSVTVESWIVDRANG